MNIDLDTLRGFFASSPFMADLGIVPTAVDVGTVHTELALAPRHTQHTGVVHAGVMATMADHSMGAAAQTMAPPSHWVLTAELKTSLLRSAKFTPGARLVCEARVLKPGRSISFTEAEVWAEVAGNPAAEAGAERAAGRVLVMKASATMAVAAVAK